MACIYVQSVKLAGPATDGENIRMHLSYRDQYNASLSHLFVHAVVHQPRHICTICNVFTTVFLLYVLRSMHIYMMVPAGCMLVWASQERCILFLDPCNENNVFVFNSFGCQHAACMPQALRPADLHKQGVVVEHCDLAYRKLARNWTTCLEDRCSQLVFVLLVLLRCCGPCVPEKKRSNKAS